jgi:predicted AAA+ superfamily ATPase
VVILQGMIGRHIAPRLAEALAESPVVLLHGARQTGKSTLVQRIAAERRMRYLTFDDAAVLASASADPAGFLGGIDGPVALDEVQRVAGLFLAIKWDVDRNRKPGRYLLTGSANVLMLPKLSESLAGRMEILPLWPLSQGEVACRPEGFIDALFTGRPPRIAVGRDGGVDLAQRVLLGGYPEALRRERPQRRRAWFSSYVATILQRDVRDLASIAGLSEMPRLLMLLASRSASLLNYSDVSRGLSLPQTTLKRYMALLEATFLVQFLPAWSGNLGNRLVKSPKLYLSDTGLAASLLGQADAEHLRQSPMFGPLVESFVVAELRKQATWSHTQPGMLHFRSAAGQEVDVVLESPAGEVVGVEIKAGAALSTADFRGLNALAQEAANRFHRGVLLYQGREVVPFGRNLHAVPIEALWEM